MSGGKPATADNEPILDPEAAEDLDPSDEQDDAARGGFRSAGGTCW